MNIYVASSWRNQYQPAVVHKLRRLNHEVYDFRNPAPGDNGFHWSEIDRCWESWKPEEFRLALQHLVAIQGFNNDRTAVESCDVMVLVLPCGRSAHLEAGYAAGMRKPLIIYMPEPCEPELMYRWSRKIVLSQSELVYELQELEEERIVNAGRIKH